MSRSIAEVLADHEVSDAELAGLVARFDANSDGRLEGEEVRAFAQAVAEHLGNDVDDVIDVLSFYQHDDDPALDPEEVRSFLELHLG